MSRLPHSPRAFRALVIALLALFMLAGFVGWEPFRGLETQLYRRILVPLLPAPLLSDKVAILGVDDRTLEVLGERWPLSPGTWSQAIERLTEFEPAAIVLDLPFERTAADEVTQFAREIRREVEASRFGDSDGARALLEIVDDSNRMRERDTVIGAAIKASDRVVLGITFSDVSTGTMVDKPRALGPNDIGGANTVSLSREGVVPVPAHIFLAARAHGSMNLLAEHNGFVHRYAYAIEHEGNLYPSLALATAQFLASNHPEYSIDASSRISQDLLEVDEAAPHLRFASDERPILEISLAELLQGESQTRKLSALRGRAIFIGPTTAGTRDFVISPEGRKIPRVEVHATALDNLLQQQWLERDGKSRWMTFLLTLIFILIFAIFVERIKHFFLLALIAFAFLLVHLATLVYAAHQHGLLLGILPLPLGLMSIGLGGLYTRWRWTRQEGVRLGALRQILDTERLALERFRGVVEHVGDAIVSVDGNQVVRWMNPAAESMFSRRAATAIDRPVAELVARLEPPRSLGQILEAQASVGGEMIPLEATASTMQVGAERFTNYVFRDVAARKALERQKDEFIASINHELRTPITSMLGSLRLINGGVMGEVPHRIHELLAIAEKNGERLLTLVSDLLDAARIDGGRLSLERKPARVDGLIEEARARFGGYAGSFEVQLELIPADLKLGERTVDIDRERIIQVFGNFISNAVKHSPRGSSVFIGVERRPENRVRFIVVDKGPGLDLDEQEAVFERFTMTIASDGRRRPGAGLGLSIAKAIVDAHGGLIGVLSEPGHGACFWFDLQALS